MVELSFESLRHIEKSLGHVVDLADVNPDIVGMKKLLTSLVRL